MGNYDKTTAKNLLYFYRNLPFQTPSWKQEFGEEHKHLGRADAYLVEPLLDICHY